MNHDPPHQLCIQPFEVQDGEQWSGVIASSWKLWGQVEPAAVFSGPSADHYFEVSALGNLGSISSWQ